MYDISSWFQASGTGGVSLISELIEENERDGGSLEGEHMIKGLGATSFSGMAKFLA